MYNWFFYTLYNYFQNKKNYNPLFHSVALVAFAQVIHFCLLSLIIAKLVNFDLKSFSNENSINKLTIFPFALIWLYLIERHYKNKVENKNLKFSKKVYKLFELILISIIFIFIPLFFLIKLSGGQIWK
jgi:hypothetical protein